MIIYRAMCKEEWYKTEQRGSPDFHKRYKWFSPSLEWIHYRVRDGRFNNSSFKQGAYDYVAAFEWDGERVDRATTNELQFDRRRNPNIKLIGLVT